MLASIYIYNEYRGYTSLDRVLEAVRARCPDEAEFIAAVEKHRADERKHYLMFKRWFERQGRMPLKVDRTCGHIDRFIEGVFGCTIEELDTAAIIADGDQFEQLCRVIMLTEQRGMRQVDVLLENRHVKSDPVMSKIFRIVEKDEPDHWLPYFHWLTRQGRVTAKWRERWTDYWIHKSLMLAKLPAIFVNRANPRLDVWPDQDATVYAAG
ncbi:ferritin-like domain-containing protein [Novosphingobium lentum]|uniref:ferritin-like domain-containing protein n=1 Tax=Novosphingobium lentum TaxID=145287 RepID=UPI000ADDAE53|nr:ferritin-like domain-containing protein [Novosphingobium lentum]